MYLCDADEFLHADYPRELKRPWKENYYFNFIDYRSSSYGIFHISFQRHSGQAIFKCMLLIDGEFYNHRGIVDISNHPDYTYKSPKILTDGFLKVEIAEPFRKHIVSFDKDDIQLSLLYVRRFDAYLYDDKSFTQASDNEELMHIIHYEQGMQVSGELSFRGQKKNIVCMGHRDHTWGYRDEGKLIGWNWIAFNTADSTWNFFQSRNRNAPNQEAGFISTSAGNIAIHKVEVIDTTLNSEGEPVITQYVVHTSEAVYSITAKRDHFMKIHTGGSGDAFVYENISQFLVQETKEKGFGIDEHLMVESTK